MATPIIMGNLGFIMIGVGDVIVAGRHSTETLAAISLATAITNCILMFGIGILVSTSALLSNYRGMGKDISKYFYPSIKFAMLLAGMTSIIILLAIPFIDKLGFEANLVPIIKDYFFITAFATFGGYLHCVTKEYLQAFEIVVFPNLVTIFCIFLNLFLNIIFVFGWKYIPGMGAIGLAMASLVVRYFMGIVLLLYCYIKTNTKKYKEFNYYKDLVKIGLPASLAIVIEFVGFNIIAIVMGRVSGIYAAAHNILLTITNVTFMLPLAISNAVSVKVGYSNGAKYIESLKAYAGRGLAVSVGFMSITALMFALFPRFLVGLFTPDENLINVCVPIVYVLACFQVFDGLQITLAGIFKGLRQTKIVMFSNLVSYWLLAFPIGYILAFYYKFNLKGFWIGILFSSVVLCTIMLLLLRKKFCEMRK
ncbi:MAG: MATE family efflux transporter [bacterium]|nr:MATE family efflux transporter [bacterium]